jgi:hypothetical protein
MAAQRHDKIKTPINKKPTLAEGERRSGEKDLERRPFNVRILASKAYECIQLYTSDDLPYLKDPHSISLEPDCLSPGTAVVTQSHGGGNILRRVLRKGENYDRRDEKERITETDFEAGA